MDTPWTVEQARAATVDAPLVATRRLEQNGSQVTVELYAPVAQAGGIDAWCRWRILGLAERPVVDLLAPGIDAVGAILSALDMIGDHLSLFEGITYLGRPDLDFPVTAATAENDPGRHGTGHTDGPHSSRWDPRASE
ncbi:DUF6968 family protein [Nocardia sp. NBC_01327]|uniref:DUF6968 family protein n=1 Tax=Nocardia sp. NBC_01327 TaxID=2903593 RepID=UPI002E0F9653|nr:hypothetical protein OG326_05980 [Nocardia sp. NBC_01327]